MPPTNQESNTEYERPDIWLNDFKLHFVLHYVKLKRAERYSMSEPPTNGPASPFGLPSQRVLEKKIKS